MKQQIRNLILEALSALQKSGTISPGYDAQFTVEECKDKTHGDFASNVALTMAKIAAIAPRQLAEKIVANLPPSPTVTSVSIAGPGFINFAVAAHAQQEIVKTILQQGVAYGHAASNGQRILIEFVSSNPTGPLHVGHGRGAAYGATLANLLEVAGYSVHREYYVNDAGRQMDILATSVWLRYLQTHGVPLTFPSNGYQGDYVITIAETLAQQQGNDLTATLAQIMQDVPADEPQGGDKEIHIDALINNAKRYLGARYAIVHSLALQTIQKDMHDDLAEFGVVYDEWFSEAKLVASGAVENAIQRLRDNGCTYEKDDATWFSSTTFGDDKDRVLQRGNGQYTYFGVDVAYHLNKFSRGFDWVINVWGADHHGYIARVKASLQALGIDSARLVIPIVQFAVLYRQGEKVSMSTRSGSFITLRELREEVGNDAARFFYVARKADQHLDFDLDLAKSQSNENPVYYIQYAHARVCSVLRQLSEKNYSYNQDEGIAALELLATDHEKQLLQLLARFPELVLISARDFEPHQIANYSREVAHAFHSYYNAHQFLVADTALRNARISLVLATKQVLQNAMKILGVSAPEKM